MNGFLENVLRFDGHFSSLAVGANGVTFDGFALNRVTGKPIVSQRHNFTAASKESLHLGMLALALSGNRRAAEVFFANRSINEHLRTIEAKLDEFDRFNASFPGFGGWLPWVANDGFRVSLLAGWTDRVPALDNGELIWGLVALLQALRQLRAPSRLAVTLAKRIDHRIAYLAYTAPIMFYDAPGSGYVRAVTKIANVSVFDPNGFSLEGVQVLDDPYEGELMVDFLCALTSLPSTECDAIWRIKQGLFVPATIFTNVTTQQGFWFSAHEQWKLLMLPYTSVDVVRAVFKLGEVARLRFSAQQRFPGLFASCTAPDGSYSSDQGVPPLAQLFTENTIVTPYGAWVALLLFPNSSVPAQWLALMLSHPQMQSSTGVVESLGIAGADRGHVMPLQTWDTKVTTDLAICGGIGELTGAFLSAHGVATRLFARIDNAYRLAFANSNVPEPDDSDLDSPTATVPIVPGTLPFQC